MQFLPVIQLAYSGVVLVYSFRVSQIVYCDNPFGKLGLLN